MTRSVLLVYHSQSGACAALARAAGEGLAASGIEAFSARAEDVGAAQVASCDGLVLVAAENSGRLAGGMKDFLDRVFYPLIRREDVKPYALLISAGNDGRGACDEVQRILRGIPFTEAMEPQIIRGLPASDELRKVKETAEAFGTGLEMGIF